MANQFRAGEQEKGRERVRHYQALVDEIAAADIVRYAGNLARAPELSGYQLYWSDPASRSIASWFQRFNWLIGLLGALALMMWGWLAGIGYRYDPPLRKTAVDPSLRGIGGWLLLPAFGVLVSPFVVLFALTETSHALATDRWAALTTFGNPSYRALWAPCLLFELVANLGLLVFAILLCVLFFQRRRSTPTFYIAFLIAAFSETLVDHVLASLLPTASSDHTSVSAEFTRMAISSTIGSAIS